MSKSWWNQALRNDASSGKSCCPLEMMIGMVREPGKDSEGGLAAGVIVRSWALPTARVAGYAFGYPALPGFWPTAAVRSARSSSTPETTGSGDREEHAEHSSCDRE